LLLAYESEERRILRRKIMNGDEEADPVQHILVFQQGGSALTKIKGIQRYGREDLVLSIISIDVALPAILDEAGDYIPRELQASLVLDYLKHPDLSDELARLCSSQGVPLIASGKKLRWPGVFTPPT
jgi:hypothetical protein